MSEATKAKAMDAVSELAVLCETSFSGKTRGDARDWIELIEGYIASLENEIDKIKEIERRRWENVPSNWRRER